MKCPSATPSFSCASRLPHLVRLGGLGVELISCADHGVGWTGDQIMSPQYAIDGCFRDGFEAKWRRASEARPTRASRGRIAQPVRAGRDRSARAPSRQTTAGCPPRCGSTPGSAWMVGRCDCSTIRIISRSSDAGYFMRVLPQARSCLFKQSVPDYKADAACNPAIIEPGNAVRQGK